MWEFVNTIMRRRKIRENSSKKRISLHDTRGRGNHQKLTKTYTKKRVYAHDTGAGEYQDILDTLKADY